MKIVFWIKSSQRKYDLSQTEYGNPGVGGTQYELSLISYLLDKWYEDIKIEVYTDGEGITSKNIPVNHVFDYSNMLHRIELDDMLLIFAQTDVDEDFYHELKKTAVRAIAWVHNYLTYVEYKSIEKTPNIKKVVFVGQQLYDHYIDTALIEKSTVIYNCIPYYKVCERNHIANHPAVVYTGALIKQKGFHVLAKAWKKILKKCPKAQLYVLGAGLYGNKAEIKKYVDKCCRYLKNDDGNLLESVHFLGVLGKEKEEYHRIAAVGVANPSGKTETFCLSAVEFEAQGIPVVTYDGYGFLDTVINKKTGICIRNTSQLADAVIRLIKDQGLNRQMGIEAKKFVDQRFIPEKIIPRWYRLFQEGIGCGGSEDEFSYKNFMDDLKWLRFLNGKIQKKLGVKRKVSIQGIGAWGRWKAKKIFKRKM